MTISALPTHSWGKTTGDRWYSQKSVMWSFCVCFVVSLNNPMENKANLRDLIAATGLVISLKLDWNCQFFSLCDLEIWWMTSKNYTAPLLHYIKLCVSSQIPPWIQTGVTVPKCTSRWFLVQCYIEIWWMALKNNRAPLLCYIKLCASFQTQWWIQCSVTVWKCSIRVKIDDILSRVTSKFYGWRWKTRGHLFYDTSSFVHHFVAIGEFKLELQSGNAQFGLNSTIFWAVWLWNLTAELEKQ